MLAYLEGSPSFKATAAALRTDLGDACASLPSLEVGALERRWASILRLQKRISELEGQLADAQTASHTADKRARGAAVVAPDFYPRSVALTLAGHRKSVTCVAIHPLFSVAASGSEDASIKLWDTEAGVCERTLTGHINAITDVCFDAGGLLLASASSDASIKLWDFGWASGPRTAAASASGAAAASGAGSAGLGSALSSATGSPGFTVGSPAAAALGSAASAAAAAGAGARAATYACLKTLRGHDGPVTGVCFAPSGGGSGPLLSCSRDGSVGVWDVDSGHCLRRMRDLHGGEWIRRLAVNAGGTVLATCSNDRVRVQQRYTLLVQQLFLCRTAARAPITAPRGHQENTPMCLNLSPTLVFPLPFLARRRWSRANSLQAGSCSALWGTTTRLSASPCLRQPSMRCCEEPSALPREGVGLGAQALGVCRCFHLHSRVEQG